MTTNRRIIIIDDNRAIHADFGKIFGMGKTANGQLSALEEDLFGEAMAAPVKEVFELASAYQGKEGFDMVHAAERDGRPFALAFVDVRMPPGWDGVETVSRLWQVSPNLEVVICTAYSDYSPEHIIERLGKNDRLQILRKPIDPAEIRNLAGKLTEKWSQFQCRH